MRSTSLVGRASWMALATLVASLMLLFVSLEGARSASAADPATYQTRVIGGSAVSDSEYPFMVALAKSDGAGSYYQFCGASLIDRDSVLTAAHCVHGKSAASLQAIVGRTVLSSSQGQWRGVSRIFVHPYYNPTLDQAYDAAVLKLDRPVAGIAPIRLATGSQNFLETAGRYATVAGWGNTIAQPVNGDAGTSLPNRMREAQVPLVSDTRGRQLYGSSFFSSLMLAAGKTGKDTCQGDSGGPLFSRVSGRFTQVGITSFGAGCGASYPGVYTEVNASTIRNFITNAASR
jgi:secreted trypsin-like serine protease